MTEKRKKELRAHFEGSDPESRAGILKVFAASGAAGEHEFLVELNEGRTGEKTEDGGRKSEGGGRKAAAKAKK